MMGGTAGVGGAFGLGAAVFAAAGAGAGRVACCNSPIAGGVAAGEGGVVSRPGADAGAAWFW